MSENIVDLRKTLNDYYTESTKNVVDVDSEGLKFIRYGLTISFVGEYSSLVLKTVKNPVSEGEQIVALFNIELMNFLSASFDKVREAVEIDDKISVLSETLVNPKTPAYDMIAATGLKVPFVEAVKSDFAIINEFLMNANNE